MLFVEFFVKLTWQVSLIRTSDYIELSGHKKQADAATRKIIKITKESPFA